MKKYIKLSKKMEKKFLFGLISLYILILILEFDPRPFTGGDNALYISLSQGIAKRGKFCEIHTPGNPSHKMYPFGYPLVLAPFSGLKSIIPMKIETGIFSIFIILLLFLLFRNSPLVFFLPLIFAFYPPFLTYSHWILTEVPFLFFVVMSIFLYKKGNIIPSFLFAMYAYFIRTVGIALIAAFVVHLLVKRQYKRLWILLAIFIILAGAWQFRNSRVKTGTGRKSYIQQFLTKNEYAEGSGYINLKDLINRMKSNFIYYAHLHGKFALLNLVILGLFLYGFGVGLKKKEVISFYLLFYLLIMLLWPEVWQDVRFILPAIPFILYYILNAILMIEKKTKQKYLLSTISILTFLIFFGIAIKSVPPLLKIKSEYAKGNILYGYPAPIRGYYASALWAKNNTPKDAVFLTRKPSMYWLFSKRKCVIYPFSSDTMKLLNTVKKYKVDYIVYDGIYSTTQRYLVPLIVKLQSNIEPIYKNRYVYILRLKKKVE